MNETAWTLLYKLFEVMLYTKLLSVYTVYRYVFHLTAQLLAALEEAGREPSRLCFIFKHDRSSPSGLLSSSKVIRATAMMPDNLPTVFRLCHRNKSADLKKKNGSTVGRLTAISQSDARRSRCSPTYQVIAKNCKTQKMIARPFLPHWKRQENITSKSRPPLKRSFNSNSAFATHPKHSTKC